jgi:formate hydrogenlyase transcriptional activator
MKSKSLKTLTSLTESEKYILEVSSLFNRTFSVDWIIDLSGEKASQVILALTRGEELGILKSPNPTHYCFKNSKLREQLGPQLDTKRIEALHGRVAKIVLAEITNENMDLTDAAIYLYKTKNDLEGCDVLVRAGLVFIKNANINEAIKCFRKAMVDLDHLESDDAHTLYFKTAIEYSKTAMGAQDTDSIVSELKSARKKAEVLASRPYQALLDMSLARVEWLRLNQEQAIDHFENGMTIVEELDDPDLMRSTANFTVLFLTWQGRYREAVKTYERLREDIESHSGGDFQLVALLSLGHSYVNTGQVTQGMGVLDAILSRSMKTGKSNVAFNALMNMWVSMLQLGKTKQALSYYGRIKKMYKTREKSFYMIALLSAFTHYLNKDFQQTATYFGEYIKLSTDLHTADNFYGIPLELCWAMEQGIVPQIDGIDLDTEIKRCLKSKHVFLRGLAYRYRALLYSKKGESSQRILTAFQMSEKQLEESGSIVELAGTRLEFANYYRRLNKSKKADAYYASARNAVTEADPDFVPEELKIFTQKAVGEQLLFKEVNQLAQETAAINDKKEVIQRIISAVNRITGSERGALFIIDPDSPSLNLTLRAAQNLTLEEIEHKDFDEARAMIKKSASTGEIQCQEARSNDSIKDHSTSLVRSCVCAPLKINDQVTGVLYHDNRLFSSSFKESDRQILSYFAIQAAAAIEQAVAYEEIHQLNQKLQKEKQYYEEQYQENLHFEEIVGQSQEIRSILSQVQKVADSNTTVLILGETGVGKELIARAVHQQSPRNDKTFIRVHSSALPVSLISSELFGHEKGAFTGADKRRVGRFELAHEGTLFLDEIGDIPLDVQIRLLRVLQTGEFERVGGATTIHSDFRLITATNRNLSQLVSESKFREDLFYRLNVFPIQIPPLRKRRDDIPPLVLYFLRRHAARMGITEKKISAGEMQKLIQYDWPGNVRELENVIERGIILSAGTDFIVPELLTTSADTLDHAVLSLEENEKRHIIKVLEMSRGKVKGGGGAAELLNIHPSTLRSKMKKLGIN